MKNAMKKLMSLLLVAVLLVSAVPFAASASTAITVQVFQEVDGVDKNWTYTYSSSEEIVSVSDTFGVTGGASLVDAENFEGAWFINPGESKTNKKGISDTIPMNGGLLKIRKEAITTVTEAPETSEPTATYKVTIVVKKDGVESAPYEVAINNASTSVQNLITYKVDADEIAGMNFVTAYTNASGYMDKTGTVNAGEKVYIAFSTPATKVEPINIVVKVESSNNVVWEGSKIPANGKTATVENLLTYAWNSDWEDVYTVDHVWSHKQQKNVARGAEIAAGDTVYFMLNEKSTSGNSGSNGNVVDEEWMKDIYLYIYTNNDIISPAKRILLNNYACVGDHRLTKTEILSVVDDYYKATNSNTGIVWKGAYLESENITALDFIEGKDETNNGTTYIEDLDVERSAHTTIVKVRVTGVTATTTSTADSSNPKTGDSIYMPVAILGISASALAAVMFFYSKKRLVK